MIVNQQKMPTNKTIKDIRIEEFNNFQYIMLYSNKINKLFDENENNKLVYLPKDICMIIQHYLMTDTYITINKNKIDTNICLSVQENVAKYYFRYEIKKMIFEKKQNSPVIAAYQI